MSIAGLQVHRCGCTPQAPCRTASRLFGRGWYRFERLVTHLTRGRRTGRRYPSALAIAQGLAVTRRSILETLRKAGARA